MSFTYHSGVVAPIRDFYAAASTAFVRGTLVRFDATTGELEPSVGSAVSYLGVCLKTVTTSATAGDLVPVQLFVDGAIFLADCSGTPTRAMAGDSVDTEGTAASPDQIDENSTTEGIFRILDPAATGTLADKKLLVMINKQLLNAAAPDFLWSA